MPEIPFDSRIFVAGARGLVGSAIVSHLNELGYTQVMAPTRQDCDLSKESDVRSFFEEKKPEFVFLAAAKVGGIYANDTYPADFLYENLLIQNNVIHQSYQSGVTKLLFLGSSCIYPKLCPQPIKEDYLLTGPLEPTNDAYAIAKIAGIKLCQAFNKQYGTQFISAMPTNLYGNNDNWDLEKSHVIPALIRKFCEAAATNSSTVEIWGTGTVKREFLHVKDLAKACVFLMENYAEDHPINVGTGKDVSIKELSLLIKELVGYDGELVFNTSKPDGTPRKVLDTNKINNLGWKPEISLKKGLTEVISHFKKNILTI